MLPLARAEIDRHVEIPWVQPIFVTYIQHGNDDDDDDEAEDSSSCYRIWTLDERGCVISGPDDLVGASDQLLYCDVLTHYTRHIDALPGPTEVIIDRKRSPPGSGTGTLRRSLLGGGVYEHPNLVAIGLSTSVPTMPP